MKLDEFVENPAEDIQDNPVYLFKSTVDGEDDMSVEIVLQDNPQRKNKMLKSSEFSEHIE